MANDNVGRLGNRRDRDLQRSHDEGFDEGLKKGRQEILDWLQHAYLDDPGRPDRGTPEAEAILKLAQDASNHFMSKQRRGRRK